jgi:hypothetical protein
MYVWKFHSRPAVSTTISLSWCDDTDIISNIKNSVSPKFNSTISRLHQKPEVIISYTRSPRHAITWIQTNQMTHDCKTLELATFLWRIAIERVLLPNPVCGWVGKFLAKTGPELGNLLGEDLQWIKDQIKCFQMCKQISTCIQNLCHFTLCPNICIPIFSTSHIEKLQAHTAWTSFRTVRRHQRKSPKILLQVNCNSRLTQRRVEPTKMWKIKVDEFLNSHCIRFWTTLRLDAPGGVRWSAWKGTVY